MRREPHSHPCPYCGYRTECDDKHLERNYDGWPEVICTLVDGGMSKPVVCDECEAKRWCEHCGGAEAVQEVAGDWVCAACAQVAEVRR
jgi:hypothetical protein